MNQVGVRYGDARICSAASAAARIAGSAISTSPCGVDATREFDGDWNEWGADLGATYQGPRQSEISFNLAPNQEYFAGTTYHNFRGSVFGSMQVSPRRLGGSGLRRGGEAIDFNNEQQARVRRAHARGERQHRHAT